MLSTESQAGAALHTAGQCNEFLLFSNHFWFIMRGLIRELIRLQQRTSVEWVVLQRGGLQPERCGHVMWLEWWDLRLILNATLGLSHQLTAYCPFRGRFCAIERLRAATQRACDFRRYPLDLIYSDCEGLRRSVPHLFPLKGSPKATWNNFWWAAAPAASAATSAYHRRLVHFNSAHIWVVRGTALQGGSREETRL